MEVDIVATDGDVWSGPVSGFDEFDGVADVFAKRFCKTPSVEILYICGDVDGLEDAVLEVAGDDFDVFLPGGVDAVDVDVERTVCVGGGWGVVVYDVV